MGRNDWLLAGGVGSLAASAAHLAVIVGGADWYRTMGAGERMARMAEAGRWAPAIVTSGIAAVLAGFGLLALSGAGVVPRPPMMRVALVVVTAVYLARGAFLFVPDAWWRPDLSPGFKFWSSAIVLALGLVHLIGVARGWTDLEGVS